jgi:hypothetical protein
MAISSFGGVRSVSSGKINNDVIDIDGTYTAKPVKMPYEDFKFVQPTELETYLGASEKKAPVSGIDLGTTGADSAKRLKDTSDDAEVVQALALQSIDQQLKDNSESARNAKLAGAGAGLFLDILNANSKYDSIKGEAALNIYLANNSVNDAIARGKTRSLNQMSQGVQRGEQSLAYLAAQGLDISSVGARNVAASQEAMGLYNGMLEEINSHREAMGYELEIAQLNYATSMAKTDRDQAVLGAIINFGATAGLAF